MTPGGRAPCSRAAGPSWLSCRPLPVALEGTALSLHAASRSRQPGGPAPSAVKATRARSRQPCALPSPSESGFCWAASPTIQPRMSAVDPKSSHGWSCCLLAVPRQPGVPSQPACPAVHSLFDATCSTPSPGFASILWKWGGAAVAFLSGDPL
jgi:hypothetical protein